MRYPKLRKEILLASIFSIVFLLWQIFSYHLDKFLPGVRIDIIGYILFAIVAGLFLKSIFTLLQRKKKSRKSSRLKYIFYVPSIILLLAIAYFFSPVKLSSDLLESRVKVRGCFQQGDTHATIVFRKNMTFEIKWKNEEGFVEWYHGFYTQNKDSLRMIYFDRNPERFGNVLVNTGTYLMNVQERPNDRLVQFRVGDCATDEDGHQ